LEIGAIVVDPGYAVLWNAFMKMVLGLPITSGLEDAIRQTQRNCDISDARFGGVFSICGLALRLRDLYRWEKRMPPWEEGDPHELLDWIGAREQYWDTLSDLDYSALRLNGRQMDPFDLESVNSALSPLGVYYGAGYARGLKPTFFIAAVEARQEIAGCRIYLLGKEMARDLLTLPALSQDRTILLRRESAQRFLWDYIAYAAPSCRRPLQAAMNACGITDQRPAALRRDFCKLLEVQESLHLHHELGEIHETQFERAIWGEIIAAFALTRVELLTRHVKDMLADTHPLGPLRHACETRSVAGLALYLALADSLARALFPELVECFDDFRRTADWAAISQVVDAGRIAAEGHAEALVSMYRHERDRNDLEYMAEQINQHFERQTGFRA
jgi:hypothetical protein